jgi:hypothetical protein
MNRIKKVFVLLVVLTLTESLMLYAQTDKKRLEIFGQIRMRSESDVRDFNSDSPSYEYTYLRSRVNFKGTYSDKIIGFIQLQDSRLFGGEDTTGATSTMKYTANVDMRLGYVQINRIFWDWLSYKFGRMEFSYGGERLLGSNQWSNIGRAFDGSALSLNFNKVQIDLFNVTLYESNTSDDTTDGDNTLTGVWTKIGIADKNNLDVYVLADDDQESDAKDRAKMERVTLGSHFLGKFGRFEVETEFNLQTGKMNYTRDIWAYYFTSAVDYTFPTRMKPSLSVGFDYLSGDDPSTKKYECFNTLYPAKHRFFGYMDYFKDMPKHNRNLGVNDLMMKTKLSLMQNLSLNIDVHRFHLSTLAMLQDSSMSRDLGTEIDLTLNFNYHESVQFRFGGSVFAPGRVFKEWKGEDPAFWFSGQATMNF